MGYRGMKVVFGGILEKTAKGCVPCGAKRASKMAMTMKKSYVLPSGTTKMFYAGRAEDVSDTDGRFLLSYTYTDRRGETHHVFTEVT